MLKWIGYDGETEASRSVSAFTAAWPSTAVRCFFPFLFFFLFFKVPQYEFECAQLRHCTQLGSSKHYVPFLLKSLRRQCVESDKMFLEHLLDSFLHAAIE